jgi:hypothetical protein
LARFAASDLNRYSGGVISGDLIQSGFQAVCLRVLISLVTNIRQTKNSALMINHTQSHSKIPT